MRIVRTTPVGVTATAPLRQSGAGGSGSFLVRADDGNQYWCKTVNNLQSPKVPVNEQIVGRLGTVIGACVCSPQLVYIPAALAGWEFRPGGHLLQEGWAHGSLLTPNAVETHALDHRAQDHNAHRHAGIYALHDWLGGSDPQWLMDTAAENRYFSHDHGHYLWGPDWTTQTLAQNRDQAAELAVAAGGLDVDEVERLAAALEGLTQEEIDVTLRTLPREWSVTDDELEAVADLAGYRARAVAARLRAR
jgi:hypothetical protein